MANLDMILYMYFQQWLFDGADLYISIVTNVSLDESH